jgi:hypothetical protein
VDATNAYFWKQATKEIQRVELASGMVSTLVTGTSYDGWFFNGGLLYYADDFNGIHRVSATGMRREGGESFGARWAGWRRSQ